MFIQTLETPNPLTLKFVPGIILLMDQSVDFATREDAQKSPLALRLFEIDGVMRVFIGEDFVSITKDEQAEWDTLKPFILSTLMDHLLAQKPILADDHASFDESDITYSEEDQPIVDQINELIETRIRPSVAMDGGDIVFSKFVDGVVFLKLRGACSGCPSASFTLKSGIESMLKHYIPEVLEVQAVPS
jgi:Fe-S cluster biogenesis protein NfuA